MPLVDFNEILPQARAEGRAVCAFNVVNCETVTAVLQAAEREKQPVICQVFHRLFDTGKAHYVAALVRHLAEQTDLNVALHLDHGQTLKQIKQAIDYGFTSVMFDGSTLPYEENIKQTSVAVKLAHDAGLTIEGEVGHIPYTENDKTPLPTAQEVLEFANETGVDALAAAVGTSHGFYKTAPVIQTDLAKEIGELVKIPLVLHGGSDTPDDKVQQVITSGFAKLNIATEFMAEFLHAVRDEIQTHGENFVPVDLFMDPIVNRISELAGRKIRLASMTQPVH